FFFFSSRRRHTRYIGDWSSDVCSSDLGHFDVWRKEGVVMHRHGLMLVGGAEPTRALCAAHLDNALQTCERYYQAFQFVLWAGKSAREALEAANVETKGEA